MLTNQGGRCYYIVVYLPHNTLMVFCEFTSTIYGRKFAQNLSRVIGRIIKYFRVRSAGGQKKFKRCLPHLK